MDGEPIENSQTRKLVITTDLIIESFVASSGSILAQELFTRGLALKYQLTTSVVHNMFHDAISSLSDSDQIQIGREMSKYHKTNSEAKIVTSDNLRKNNDRSFSQALLANMPKGKTAQELDKEIQDNGFDANAVNRALLELMNNSDNAIRVSSFKSLCAFLGFYDERNWWIDLYPSQKTEMQKIGKQAYERSLSRNPSNSSK